LSTEIRHLKTKLDETLYTPKTYNSSDDRDTETNAKLDTTKDQIDNIKNLTDADKLLRDENKLLKIDLEEKSTELDKVSTEMNRNVLLMTQLRTQVASKETQLEEAFKKEKLLKTKLDESSKQVNELSKRIELNEQNLQMLKDEISAKNKIENSLVAEADSLNEKLKEMGAELKDRTGEVTKLAEENKSMKEKIGSDADRLRTFEEDLSFHKSQISSLNKDLGAKNAEIRRIEDQLKAQEAEIKQAGFKATTADKSLRSKMDEVVSDREDLVELQRQHAGESKEWESKVGSLTREIDRLNSERDRLTQAYGELSKIHEQCGGGVEGEKGALKRLESQVLNAKFESKVQYLEIEIDTLRSKVRKLLKEKEVQDRLSKENQSLVKEIALKYKTDSDSWNRQKSKLLEKEKLVSRFQFSYIDSFGNFMSSLVVLAKLSENTLKIRTV